MGTAALPTDQKPPDDDAPTGSSDTSSETVGDTDAGVVSGPEQARAGGKQDAHAPGPDAKPLVYNGKSNALFRLGLKVTLLTVVTAYIYSFWGKTRIRQYLWGRLTLLGDRLTYTGTGRELFIGFLLAMAVLVPIFILKSAMDFVLAGRDPVLAVLPQIFLYVTLAYLAGVATYLARRYRLSRTLWRGIRFGQTGSALYYGLLSFGWIVANILTLGLINPVGSVQLQRVRICNTWFGNRHFVFNGRAGDLYKRWLLCWVLAPFTLGLSVIWYRFFELSYFVSRTGYQGLRFRLPIMKRDIVRIFLPIAILYLAFVITVAVCSGLAQWSAANNETLISGISLGVIGLLFLAVMFLGRALVLSIVVHRFATMVADKLSISGETNLEGILQNMQALAGSGEGLAAALDVGSGVDIGL